MIARVAVLSDIHGVLPSLEAVLNEPDVRDADRIVLNGDIAAGPMPVETLDLLRALGERACWVRGNADRELVTLYHGGRDQYSRPHRPVGGRPAPAGVGRGAGSFAASGQPQR